MSHGPAMEREGSLLLDLAAQGGRGEPLENCKDGRRK